MRRVGLKPSRAGVVVVVEFLEKWALPLQAQGENRAGGPGRAEEGGMGL